MYLAPLLSRPRCFGMSMLRPTLMGCCKGRNDLFQGPAIDRATHTIREWKIA
ncbi:MAG: hypothetical protein IJ613_11050 [Muribaculaceae bacterium]|nr:hypothetical protein [Muribaculaceae bacterium]